MEKLPTQAQMANFAAFEYALVYELRHLGGITRQYHQLEAENLQDAQREAFDFLVELGSGEEGGGYDDPDMEELLENFGECSVVVTQLCDCPPIDEEHPMADAVLEALRKHEREKRGADAALEKAERRQQFERLKAEFEEKEHMDE